MLRRFAIAILLLVLALAAMPAAAATPDEQARLLQLVNETRAAHGLVTVAASPQLTASAEGYAAYMAGANFFGHDGPNGSTYVGRNEAAGYTGWIWIAENIAAGQTSADAVFQAWMNSDGHRANILNPSAREMGIGHAYVPTSTYHHYWTMELGARSSAPVVQAPAPTATPQPTATPRSYPLPRTPGRYRVVVPTAPK